MAAKNKYFCQQCLALFEEQEIVEHDSSQDSEKEHKGQPVEPEKRSYRVLTCQHYVPLHVPGIKDYTNDTLSEEELKEVREIVAKSVLGKTKDDLERTILFQVDQYQTMMAIASKQQKQAKYAIMQLDRMLEQYSKDLSEDEQEELKKKFKAFLNPRLKPTHAAAKQELTSGEKAREKEKAALQKIKEMLKKSGHEDLVNKIKKD